MTNREKYAKEILDIVCSGGRVALIKGKIVDCNNIEQCTKCDFSRKILV